MMIGTGMGWDFGLGWIAMMLFWVFIVAGIAWLVVTLARPQRERSDAAAILAERFARGEIDSEEFAARRRALREGTR